MGLGARRVMLSDGQSLPPTVRTVTWPFVAYTLVRELPHMAIVGAGLAIGVVLVIHSPAATVEGAGAVLAHAVVGAFSRRLGGGRDP